MNYIYLHRNTSKFLDIEFDLSGGCEPTDVDPGSPIEIYITSIKLNNSEIIAIIDEGIINEIVQEIEHELKIGAFNDDTFN